MTTINTNYTIILKSIIPVEVVVLQIMETLKGSASTNVKYQDILLVSFQYGHGILTSCLTIFIVTYRICQDWHFVSPFAPVSCVSPFPCISVRSHQLHLVSTVQKPQSLTPCLLDYQFICCVVLCIMTLIVNYYCTPCSAIAQSCLLCLRFTCIYFSVSLPLPGCPCLYCLWHY